MISVVNGKTDGFVGENTVYVGRAMNHHENPLVRRGSVLGNPFKTRSKLESARKQVVEQYREWLRQQVRDRNPEVCQELERLKRKVERGEDLRLVCWCGTVCHAEVIREAIQGAIERKFSFWSNVPIEVGDWVVVDQVHQAQVTAVTERYLQVDGETIVGWVNVKRVTAG